MRMPLLMKLPSKHNSAAYHSGLHSIAFAPGTARRRREEPWKNKEFPREKVNRRVDLQFPTHRFE